MAKITAQNIIDMGFTPEMFGKDSAGFQEMIETVIDEQADILEGRIGSQAYSATEKPAATYVKRAEKCLVAAEMIQARVVKIMGNAVPNGAKPVTGSLDRQKQKYLDEAEGFISKIVSGASADSEDFVSGVLVTSSTDRSTFLANQET